MWKSISVTIWSGQRLPVCVICWEFVNLSAYLLLLLLLNCAFISQYKPNTVILWESLLVLRIRRQSELVSALFIFPAFCNLFIYMKCLDFGEGFRSRPWGDISWFLSCCCFFLLLIQVNEGSASWTHHRRFYSVTFAWTLERARHVRN